MLGRRLIGAFFAVVLIIAVVTFVLGYLLLRPLFYGETANTDVNLNIGAAPFANDTGLRAYVSSVDAGASTVRIIAVDGVSLVRYTSTTRLQQLGGSPVSINQIYQCATITATDRRDGTAFIADVLEVVPVMQASAGVFRADIVIDSVNLLAIPDQRTAPIATLTRGMRLDLLGRCKDWLAVIAPGNVHGWLRRDPLNVTTDQLNQLPWLALDPSRLRP